VFCWGLGVGEICVVFGFGGRSSVLLVVLDWFTGSGFWLGAVVRGALRQYECFEVLWWFFGLR
jgi:hypothetical protein